MNRTHLSLPSFRKTAFRKTACSLFRYRQSFIFVSLLVLSALKAAGQTEPAQQFNAFVKQQAAALRAKDIAPATLQEWTVTRNTLRARLLDAWGGFPEVPCALEPQKLGELKRDGYTIEKVVFQTMPGVLMTANAYVPGAARAKKYPAVLCVHGHWAGAKQDPVVQSRCIGLVKLGFFVLCVDAFGAGERGIGKNLGEYHGEMTGAALLPIGRPLSGIQVYENMRAVDYLQSRPEVDPDRIGITGASGGGNQTMYAGAFDDRFRCVVPTCSVGNYQAYLSAACCMCEVVPGILRFSEEGDVLGLAANRGLMVTSATQDAFQFSVDQAKVSVARAKAVAALSAPTSPSSMAHTIIESPHHYNQPMREAMYGWMTKHLKGEGDGSPIPEPKIVPEDPETLRCFPGDTRPDSFMTLPMFAAAQARQLLKVRHAGPDQQHLATLSKLKSDEDRTPARAERVAQFVESLGGMPEVSPLNLRTEVSDSSKSLELTVESEPGLLISVRCDLPRRPIESETFRLAIILDVDNGADAAFSSVRANEFRSRGWTIVAPELRATGQLAFANDKIGNAPDHNSAEWSLWIGRPLLGQWAWDVHRTLETLKSHFRTLPRDIAIIGEGSSGVIALTSAALDERLTHVMTFDSLTSFVSDSPYRGQRLGILVPGLLRDVGDVDHIAALIAPRKLTIHGDTQGDGGAWPSEEDRAAYSFCREVYTCYDAAEALSISATTQP